MAIPPLELSVIEIKLRTFCDKIPENVRDRFQLNFKVEGQIIILFERRPDWRDRSVWRDLSVAKFRYVSSRKIWQLFCKDQNNNWRQYDKWGGFFEAKDFETLFREVADDPTHIFWG